MRNGDLRLLSAGITRNIHLEAENGALREFVEQLQSRVGELQERIVELRSADRNGGSAYTPVATGCPRTRGHNAVGTATEVPIWAPRALRTGTPVRGTSTGHPGQAARHAGLRKPGLSV